MYFNGKCNGDFFLKYTGLLGTIAYFHFSRASPVFCHSNYRSFDNCLYCMLWCWTVKDIATFKPNEYCYNMYYKLFYFARDLMSFRYIRVFFRNTKQNFRKYLLNISVVPQLSSVKREIPKNNREVVESQLYAKLSPHEIKMFYVCILCAISVMYAGVFPASYNVNKKNSRTKTK